MRNVFALKQAPGSNIPDEIYGYRPYLLAFSAAWVSSEAVVMQPDVTETVTRLPQHMDMTQLSLAAHLGFHRSNERLG